MQITILSTNVRQDESGLFCLNDLHKAAGGHSRHLPSKWLHLQRTQATLKALKAKTGIPVIHTKQQFGTFVPKIMLYDYASWVSPEFNILVLEVFEKHVQEQIAALANDAASYQAIARSSDDLLISDAAIILKVKQKEFFTFLSKGLGWIYKRGNVWRPKQKAVDDGYVARRCSKYFKGGEEKRSYQTVITEMGMAFAQQRRLAA